MKETNVLQALRALLRRAVASWRGYGVGAFGIGTYGADPTVVAATTPALGAGPWTLAAGSAQTLLDRAGRPVAVALTPQMAAKIAGAVNR